LIKKAIELAKRKGKSSSSKGVKQTRSTKKPNKPANAAKSKNYVTNEKSGAAQSGNAKPKSWRRRILRYGLVLILALALIPVLLGFLYRSQSVHPVSTLMVYDWIRGSKVDRRWVSFDKIAPQLVQAVVVSEDGRYCAHNGVDWEAVNIIINDAMDGEKPRGASTITMQTVKNLFLWSSRSYVRKGMEVPLALYVNAIWSKRRQMEIYLNIAEWGPGIYGIDAASRHYFGRRAAKLSRAQAALLAVTLPNPILRNPKKPSRRMKTLARINRARARKSGAYVLCLKQG
jgi:monofunctional biosynthetic peptidoglycan transglycosylase